MIYSGPLRPICIFDAPVAGAPVAGLMPGMGTTRDLSDLGGDGKITGTTNKGLFPGVPVGRRVRLFCERDNRLVGEVWSDSLTGDYAFYNINRALKYSIVAYDHTGFYNAKIIAGATADPM